MADFDEVASDLWRRLVESEAVELVTPSTNLSDRLATILARHRDAKVAAERIIAALVDAPGIAEVFADEETVVRLVREIASELSREPVAGVAAARDPRLEQLIVDDPANREARVVYGDWLQAQGDPRGELIALQAAGLEARAGAYLARHAASLLGPLADHQTTYERDVGDRTPAFEWHLGFIRAARFAYGGPSYDIEELELNELLRALATHPSAVALERLVLGENIAPGNRGETAYAPLFATLTSHTWPCVRELVVGDLRRVNDPSELGRHVLGRLPRLDVAFPRLRSLTLQGSWLVVDEPALPPLRRLEVRSPDRQASLATTKIVAAVRATLESLTYWYAEPAQVDALLAAGPRLRELRLPECKDEEAIRHLLSGRRIDSVQVTGRQERYDAEEE